MTQIDDMFPILALDGANISLNVYMSQILREQRELTLNQVQMWLDAWGCTESDEMADKLSNLMYPDLPTT